MIRMRSNIVIKVISAILLSFLLITAASAQTDQGRIGGTVTDPNGAVLAGATVTVTNEKTGKVRTIATDKDGAFKLAALEPATYTIAVTSGDFQVTMQRGVEVLVGAQKELSFTMQPKGVAVNVDVVGGEDAVVNTTSASMGANVS